MRMYSAMMYAALAASLTACEQQNPAAHIDPELGYACFESQRASLPPGTQYEGIVKLEDNRITIKIMTGVELVTVDCPVNNQ